jgi:glycosyltransferase involved in cell wall biosynthesis
MKITIITNYWKNGNGGGITTYLTGLVNEFVHRNINTKVIFKYGLDPLNYHISGNKLIFSMKSYLILIKITPDVIYSQGTWYCLLPGFFYKKIHGCKLIHTFHTEPESNEKLNFCGKLFFQYLLDRCDYVTFVSEKLKQKTQEILELNLQYAEITYAGVNIPPPISDKKINEFKMEYGIKEKNIVLLAMGLTALKYKAEGAKLLIKAMKILYEKYPNIILILTREGLYSGELKEFSKQEKISNNIIFTGNIDDPYVALKICDIYTHTALGEGLPLAILEAMSLGKPIIAIPAGGIPEVIVNSENGILVDPDENQIAEKIEYLLRNKNIAKMLGENAKNTAEEKFTWQLSADKFIELANR